MRGPFLELGLRFGTGIVLLVVVIPFGPPPQGGPFSYSAATVVPSATAPWGSWFFSFIDPEELDDGAICIDRHVKQVAPLDMVLAPEVGRKLEIQTPANLFYR